MSPVRKLKADPAVGGKETSFEALQARLLEGAAERIHADVEEAKRRGLVDDEGVRVSRALPEEMLPGAKRDFGG